MSIRTEIASCMLCGSQRSERLFEGGDLLHHVPGNFAMVRCMDCSFVYLNPRPAWPDMQMFYPSSYAPFDPNRDASPINRFIQSGGLRRKRRILERQKPGGVLLDVGCAAGDFLGFVQQDGKWQVFGVEPDAATARYAAERLHAEVYTGRLEDVDLPTERYDVVTMWHVLEHLYEPVEVMRRVRASLRPDGRFIVAVPVLNSLDAHLFGKYWAGYDVPRHLSVFSKATLQRMMQEAGFGPVRFESFIGGFSAFSISLGFWAYEKLRSRPRTARLFQSVSGSIPFRISMIPYFSLVNLLGAGSTMVAVAYPDAHAELA